MQISSRFTIAVHIITCIDYFHEERSMTSDFIASSVGVNPVMIRQIILQLKAAGIVEVSRGKGGIVLSRPLEDVTLYDIYEAVESVKGRLFRFHENPNPNCPVGRNVHALLDDKLADAKNAMLESLSKTTLADLAKDMKILIKEQEAG